MTVEIRQGEAREVLATLPARSAHSCITSPPYFGLRSYGCGEQEIGTEQTPAAYVAHLVEVFRAVHRVLRPDGTCWIVMGDSYAAGGLGAAPSPRSTLQRHGANGRSPYLDALGAGKARRAPAGLKPKDLMMVPHRVALALQENGWYVRNDCVWAKGNSMPESVQDRFSRAHEYVFHLAKSEHYYFDAVAVAEPTTGHGGVQGPQAWHKLPPETSNGRSGSTLGGPVPTTRNRRSVLHVNPQPFSAADFGFKDIDHYAVFPEKLVEILTLCSTSEAGCCPRCAAPWGRVVERAGGTWEDRKEAGAPLRYGTQSPKGSALNRMGVSSAATVEWQAGCTCHAGPPIPCTTLDPFLGSGTTALVSKRLGRACVGIELNENYCELARRRVESVPYTLFSGAASTQGAAR